MRVTQFPEYRIEEHKINVGDLYIRADKQETVYAITSLQKREWLVGNKKKKKMCCHMICMTSLSNGDEITLDPFVFRKFYIDNAKCKKLWSIDVVNKRNDC